MIRRASRRLVHKAREMKQARAYVAELEVELARLNGELAERLAGELRPARRAAAVLFWASESAEVLAELGEVHGDVAEIDGVAATILTAVRQAVEGAVPAMLEEEVPHLGRANVADFIAVALEALEEEGAPVVPAIPVITAVLSWHVAVYDAMDRLDVPALRRLAIIAPYANARYLAEVIGGALGPVLARWTSRAICRTHAVAVDRVAELEACRARCRRRGPPSALAATPNRPRYVVGTSPNAPPVRARSGAVVGAHVRRSDALGEPPT